MLNEVFHELTMFQGLSDEQIEQIRPLFIPCDFYADTMLFEQGDLAEFLYLVVSGEVLVAFKPDDGPPITVARVRCGGMVGWSAALGSPTYTSGAMCTTYTQLLRVRGADMRKLCDQQPEIGMILLDRLAAVIAQRLSNTHEQVMALLELGLRSGIQTGG